MYSVGSLFTGVGGIDLAFQEAGFRIDWQVEIDDYCNKVLERHWPGVPRLRDVRAVTGRSGKGWWRYHQVPRVDVLTGGFPCTDISVAGKGAGLAGEQSGLWFEFERLISELRPRVVFLENVPAIAFRGGPTVVGALAEMGYVGAWGVISAADAGASHRRERWWCVAYSEHRRHEERQRVTRHYAPSGNEAWGEPERNRSDVGLQALADTASVRRQRPTTKLGSARTGETGGRLFQLEGTPCAVGDSHSAGREQQRRTITTPAQQPTIECPSVAHPTRQRIINNGRGNGTLPDARKSGGAGTGVEFATQSDVGRTIARLPARLDVARPGQPQHAWEAPRTVPPGSVPHRASRLKALGNAVVPQVVYPIAVEIMQMLCELDS